LVRLAGVGGMWFGYKRTTPKKAAGRGGMWGTWNHKAREPGFIRKKTGDHWDTKLSESTKFPTRRENLGKNGRKDKGGEKTERKRKYVSGLCQLHDTGLREGVGEQLCYTKLA